MGREQQQQEQLGGHSKRQRVGFQNQNQNQNDRQELYGGEQQQGAAHRGGGGLLAAVAAAGGGGQGRGGRMGGDAHSQVGLVEGWVGGCGVWLECGACGAGVGDSLESEQECAYRCRAKREQLLRF